jgi:hypothetical protein
MRLDEDGMTYKGQRIEDGGEAHRAFLEVMSAMQRTPRTDTEITSTGAYTCTHHNDAEREKAERYRLASLKLDAELAKERARLDWLESPSGMDWQWEPTRLTVSRASIDAAMKEDAK